MTTAVELNSATATRKDAWQWLGTQLPENFTAEQAIIAGGLGGWNLRKLPLSTEIVEGMFIPVPGRFAVVRDNPHIPGQIDVLSDNGRAYRAWQNEELCDLLNALAEESGAIFSSAGEIDGGRKVFVTLKLPGYLKVGGVDVVKNHLALVCSHDGSMVHTGMVTPVRPASGTVLARESFPVKIHPAEALRMLDRSFTYLDSFQEKAERMASTPMTQLQFEKVIARAFGAPAGASSATVTRTERKLEEMVELFTPGTAWAGFCAITEWVEHHSPTRGDDPDTTRAIKAILDPNFKRRALTEIMKGF